jgi:hypothetical protein
MRKGKYGDLDGKIKTFTTDIVGTGAAGMRKNAIIL